MAGALALGIDFGTSGVRAIAIALDGTIAAATRLGFDSDRAGSGGLAADWRQLLFAAIAQLPADVRSRIGRIAIDGTSGTALLCDRDGIPLDGPLLYNDDRGGEFADTVRAIVPGGAPAASATSAFSKLWWWRQTRFGGTWPAATEGLQLLHQADWLALQLHGRSRQSDYHNALKLGYDPVALRYPAWLLGLDVASALPEVAVPGTVIAPVLPDVSRSLGLPTGCHICAGTTDSIAAFLAAGCDRPGQAVTSLGSTMALKLLSRVPVADRDAGVYSHRFGVLWLAGGASNSGGAVLRHLFPPDEFGQLLDELRDRTDGTPSPYDYYPLIEPGERFPINDPALPPRLDPRPPSRAEFLYGILDGLAAIEATGYAKLAELGADRAIAVLTAGGGAHNPISTALRTRRLGIPVAPSPQADAAYGTARLAAIGLP